MDGIAGNLPSLLYATKVQKKAASVGFDWADVHGAFPKVAEETAELAAVIESGDAKAIADELGDLLFAVTTWPVTCVSIPRPRYGPPPRSSESGSPRSSDSRRDAGSS